MDTRTYAANPFDNHDFLNDEITISTAVESLIFLDSTKPKVFFHGLTRDCEYVISKGCCPADIHKLEKHIGFTLPNDYKEFLLIANGIRFSHFVSSLLYDIENLYQSRDVFDQYPDNYLVIGSCSEGAFNIMLRLDDKNNQCMYLHEIGNRFLNQIKCNFTNFFNQFIMTYGSPFWEWGAKNTQIEAIVHDVSTTDRVIDCTTIQAYISKPDN